MAPSLIEQLAAAPAVGEEYRPFALAPGGDAVAFEWYQGGDWQIFLKTLPDGEPRPHRRPDDRCGCPQFSPDGRYLYFTCDDRGSECYDVYRYELSTGQPGQPASGHAGPRPSARPRPLAGRLSARHDRLARRRLRRRRDAGAAESRRRRHPAPHRAPLHRVLAALVAGRRAPGRDQRHARPGHRGLRHRRRVRRVARGRRLRGVLRRPARVVARRPAPRLRRRARRPSGHRHLRARAPAPSAGPGRTTTSTPTTRRGRRTARRSPSSCDVEGETGLLPPRPARRRA